MQLCTEITASLSSFRPWRQHDPVVVPGTFFDAIQTVEERRMPTTLSYPGAYLEELPSAVRTITGVATSTAAFVGQAGAWPGQYSGRDHQLFGF